MPRSDGNKVYSWMRRNTGGMAGGAWGKKNNRRKARRIIKRKESRQWRVDNDS